MTIEKQPFEDVFPIKDGDFPATGVSIHPRIGGGLDSLRHLYGSPRKPALVVEPTLC